ncbi:MAG: galactose-1-phosphate uridylyltransferase, partial [Lachnospiraceae bacterium]|nr:galactose-1-phosphate uridylyltransferase [Lachnospiraceae bacterium]
GEPHNTITPIARMRDGKYELDLALRNNLTTEDRPMGLYHPRQELHHIKKENIGLIEVMGLAVLPSRLKKEMEEMRPYVVRGDIDGIRKNEMIDKHADWVESFLSDYKAKGIQVTEENVDRILEQEIGKVFCQVLEDAGVYKFTEEGQKAFHRFIDSL